MDVLIFSCGTGGGHNSAGKAVLEEMQIRGHNVKFLNPYSLRSNKLESVINNTYIKTVQKTPKLFGAIYKAGDLYRKLPFRSPVYFINRGMEKTIRNYLCKNHFDVVIMPHIFPGEILTNLRNHGFDVPKTIFIATDYVCIPFTEEIICDAYIAPAEDLVCDFTNRKIPKTKIYPYGIPVKKSFSENISKSAAKEILGLDINKKYIIISGGSMGAGKIEKAISELESAISNRDDIRLAVICGSNAGLYDKLISMDLKKTKIIGSTDKMAVYLHAGEVFITKPGGLSSTEAAVCGIPILHTISIPGCETKNAHYFEKHKMSKLCASPEEIAENAIRFIDNEKYVKEMIFNQKKYISSQAAKSICDLAESICETNLKEKRSP